MRSKRNKSADNEAINIDDSEEPVQEEPDDSRRGQLRSSLIQALEDIEENETKDYLPFDQITHCKKKFQKLIPLESSLKNLEFFSKIVENKYFFHKSHHKALTNLSQFEEFFRRILLFGCNNEIMKCDQCKTP